MSNRTDRRDGMNTDVRVRLLESDMDDLEAMGKRLEGAIDGVRRALIGILISVTTASVLLALNLAVGTAVP